MHLSNYTALSFARPPQVTFICRSVGAVVANVFASNVTAMVWLDLRHLEFAAGPCCGKASTTTPPTNGNGKKKFLPTSRAALGGSLRLALVQSSFTEGRTMNKHCVALGAVALCLLMNRAAAADVIPPEVLACNQLDAGATCTTGIGHCQPGTCSKLDYSNWDAGSGHGPPTVSYACLKCIQGPLVVDAGTGSEVPEGSCACRVVGMASQSNSYVALGGLLGLALVRACRRRPLHVRG